MTRRLVKRNPFYVATLTGILYFAAYCFARYLFSQDFDTQRGLIGAVVFWVIYFFLQISLNIRIDRQQ
ncbi:hypothetical protein HZA33_05335 [Candidatus Pacearchaeota archaeon]|nr:hypothetical protein [Candidatus Pacearchaeota archaeon]